MNIRFVKDISMLRKLIPIFFILMAVEANAAEPASPEDRYAIHVLTMGPGDALFARFGHIALVVEDRRERTKKVYNFGTFDFSDPDLQQKYASGFLNFWLSIESYGGTIRRYRAFDRDLWERTLNLDPDRAAEVAHRLALNAKPENRTYAYRHYLDNCCTRVRDVIDDATDGALSKDRSSSNTGRTYRDHTRDALRGLWIMRTLILFSLGPAVDRPITRFDEQFLPAVVAEDLDHTFIGPDQRPIVARKRHLVARRGEPVERHASSIDVAIAGVFFALLALGLVLPLVLGQRRMSARLLGLGYVVWGLVAGLGGLALVLYWTATTHYDTHYNENLLIFPVSHLWLVGPGLGLIFRGHIKSKTSRFIKKYFIFSFVLIAADMALKLGPFIQSNWAFIAVAAACNAAGLAGLARAQTSGRQQ